jgi:S1-C subfamily serine protease
MTTLDWIIAGFVALMVLNGLRQGFLAGALQLIGFVAGAIAGSRVAPLLLPEGASSPYAPIFALGGAVLLGSFLGGGLQLAAVMLRTGLRLPGLAAVDGALGALLGGALGLGVAWIAGSVALQTPRLGVRRDIQRSHVLRELNRRLPPSGFILHSLARFDPLPEIAGPGASGVAAPTGRIARVAPVRAAAGGVVRVLGTACGLGVEGSGWVAATGLVVTNAHVVAGEQDTVVQARGAGPRLAARVVAFDAHDDVAVLRVPGLGATALAGAPEPPAGRAVAILGFPHNGPYDVRSARVGPTREVLSEDAYGRGPVRRRVTTFRGKVRSGNSGGPLVDARGRVAGTVFAAAVGGGARGGYAVPGDVVAARVAAAGRRAVSTGPCAR